MIEIAGRDARTGEGMHVFCEDGMIVHVETGKVEEQGYLSAGLVDLQVNGFAGFDVNAPEISIEAVAGLTVAMLVRGVTCFAPTIISASEETMCHALSVIAQARRDQQEIAACIPFVHMEGPYLSALDGYRGAHPKEAIRAASCTEFDRWQEASDGLVGMVTLSPHDEAAGKYIRYVTKRGVHVAIGHTHASADQIRSAVDAGARLSTHLGNGIAREIPRHQNPLWSQLADARLTATVIADGHHVPPDFLQVVLRAKGLRNVALVSDAVALAGLPPGEYETPVGGSVELRADGRLCLRGSEFMAGSTASLPQCVAAIMRMTQLPLADALMLATETPGRFVGGRGTLAVGSFADIVRFEWNGEMVIRDVWLRGKRVSAT